MRPEGLCTPPDIWQGISPLCACQSCHQLVGRVATSGSYAILRIGCRHLPRAPSGYGEDGVSDKPPYSCFFWAARNACTGYDARGENMDAQQLKLLAGRVRDLLAQHNHLVVHGQALDLIAALPGLRNWSEVMAFPARVADCRLSESAATRLAYRLKSRFGLDMETPALLQILDPSQAGLPELWPTGPEPGVYVTTSQDAINALTAQYSEATDGAALYAESAGLGADGAIDLGEYGDRKSVV